MATTENKVGVRWSKDEDNLLRQFCISNYVDHDSIAWVEVARQIGGRRTPQMCMNRWQQVLVPGLNKGPWSEEEDKLIHDCVNEGNPKWSDIALKLPGRIGKQIRERWYNHLDPSLKKGTPWTPQEVEVLFAEQRRRGNQWKEISTYLPGRSENDCKNKFNVAARKRKLTSTADHHQFDQSPSQGKRARTGGTQSSSSSSAGHVEMMLTEEQYHSFLLADCALAHIEPGEATAPELVNQILQWLKTRNALSFAQSPAEYSYPPLALYDHRYASIESDYPLNTLESLQINTGGNNEYSRGANTSSGSTSSSSSSKSSSSSGGSTFENIFDSPFFGTIHQGMEKFLASDESPLLSGLGPPLSRCNSLQSLSLSSSLLQSLLNTPSISRATTPPRGVSRTSDLSMLSQLLGHRHGVRQNQSAGGGQGRVQGQSQGQGEGQWMGQSQEEDEGQGGGEGSEAGGMAVCCVSSDVALAVEGLRQLSCPPSPASFAAGEENMYISSDSDSDGGDDGGDDDDAMDMSSVGHALTNVSKKQKSKSN